MTTTGERSDWKRFLATGSSGEVLARIVEGDPLRVGERVAERLAERALLLDAERVALGTLARVARLAPHYRGRPEFSAWLGERTDEAIDDLLRTEEADEETDDDGAHAVLARPLGLDPRRAREACRAFNRCSDFERACFFSLVFRARGLDEAAEELSGAPTEIARAARRVLDYLMRPETLEPEELP